MPRSVLTLGGVSIPVLVSPPICKKGPKTMGETSDRDKTWRVDVNAFRSAVTSSLTDLVGGTIEDTGHHLRISGGQYDCGEVQFEIEKSGYAYAVLVDGKKVRMFTKDNTENQWTVIGALIGRLKAKQQHLERLRKEREDTEQILLLLNKVQLPKDPKIRCNVLSGKLCLDIKAAFGPKRVGAGLDLIEMARLTLEDGDTDTIPDDAEECDADEV